MNNEETRAWLDARWEAVLAEEPGNGSLETDQFVDSAVLSIRYAVLTQLLSRVEGPPFALSLSKGHPQPARPWEDGGPHA